MKGEAQKKIEELAVRFYKTAFHFDDLFAKTAVNSFRSEASIWRAAASEAASVLRGRMDEYPEAEALMTAWEKRARDELAAAVKK